MGVGQKRNDGKGGEKGERSRTEERERERGGREGRQARLRSGKEKHDIAMLCDERDIVDCVAAVDG